VQFSVIYIRTYITVIMFRASSLRLLRIQNKRQFTTTSISFYPKVIPEAIQGTQSAAMDGRTSADAVDDGAKKTTINLDQSEAIPEHSNPKIEKATGTGTPAFSKDGAIGSAFKADGAIGGMADKVGGPFSKDGAIGKNFNPDGAIGGTVHENLGKKE